jgi:hypothetical protein
MLQYIALSPILSFSFSRVLCSLSTRFPYNPSDRPFSFTAFILHFSSSNNTPVSGVEITFTFTSFHFQLALKYLISRFEKAQRGWCVGGAWLVCGGFRWWSLCSCMPYLSEM